MSEEILNRADNEELQNDNMELIDSTELHNLRYNLQVLQETIKKYEAELLSAQENNATLNVRITVLEEQRNSLTEQLTQANINRKIEHHNTVQTANNAIQREQESGKIRAAALHQQLTTVTAELEELKTKFGESKHRQKVAEASLTELSSAQESIQHKAERTNTEYNEIFDATTWLLNVSANFNGNIEKTIDRALTVSDIRAAYLRHPSLGSGNTKINVKKLQTIFKI